MRWGVGGVGLEGGGVLRVERWGRGERQEERGGENLRSVGLAAHGRSQVITNSLDA